LLQGILLLTFLLMLNAFFSASEIALISLNDNKIKVMAEEGDKKAKMLKSLLGEPSKFLATIQVGITLAGFMASAFAAENFAYRLSGAIKSIGVPVPDAFLNTLSLILITIVLSYFTLVLGELVPKRIAMKKSEPISMAVVGPLTFLMRLTSPFVRFLTFSTNFFIRLFGIDPNEADGDITEEEIRMMIDVGQERGTIHETEKLMINNIFEFNNKIASDIMTHRTDIVALELESSLLEVVSLVSEEKYSRIPVYDKSIDNVVGILHTKDLIHVLTSDSAKENFSLSGIMRKPYFVPESRKTDELFRDLQRDKTPISIVIDEYGGTAGIATIEDLVEEIVGEILDEYDEDENMIVELDDGSVIIDGLTSLDDVQGYFDVDLPIDEYDTLSGFIVGSLGRIPEEGETPSIQFSGYLFEAEGISEKMVTKVKVTKMPDESEEIEEA
jgi:putative hemolysin